MFTTKRILPEIEANFIVQKENKIKCFRKLYVPASTVQATGIGNCRIPRRTGYEYDCEANAGQPHGKNKNKYRQIAAESLENDTNHENNKISKLKLHQYPEGISVSNRKTVERAGRTNRDMKKATTEA